MDPLTEVHDLRQRVVGLEAQVAFLYKHLKLTFVPESPLGDAPLVVEQLRQGNMEEAIRMYRELSHASLEDATKAVEELQGRLER